jgi:CubicO group peptidase (beta-lactamase class C family)
MEKAIGLPFTDIIRDNVSVPLHLASLKPDQVDSTTYPRVTFYNFEHDSLLVAPSVDNSNKWAGGGFLCSADDLTRFGAALAGPGFLKKKTLEEYTTTQYTLEGAPTGNGIGFFNGRENDGDKWYGHSGGSVGGTSMLVIYPERKLVVVTLVNLSSARMDDLARKIADIIPSSRTRKAKM